MELTENQTNIYVGGGLTADSVPELEWEETKLKAETMLAVIQKFI
jgi:isochorismate synthase